MIKQNELRLGNLLSYTEEGLNHCTVFGLDDNSIGVEDDESPTWENESNLYPIPLTEEILLNKCKAEKVGSEWQIEYNDTTFIFEGSLGRGYYYTGGEGCKLSVLFYNLHQLQNLYFALTGEELEVKL